MQPISQGCIAWWCCVLTHWGQNGHINKLRVKAGTARYCNPRPGSSSIPLAFKLWPSWSLVYCAKDFGQITYSNAICFYLYSVYILSWAPTKRPSLSVFFAVFARCTSAQRTGQAAVHLGLSRWLDQAINMETSNHPPQPQLRHISSSFTNSWPGFHNFYGAIPRRDRRHNRDTLPSLLWLYTPIKQHSLAKELIRQPQFLDRLLGKNSFTYNHFNKSIWVHCPRGTMPT